MEAVVAALLLMIGLVVGGAAAWWLRGREIAAERERAAALAAAERAAHEERVAALTKLRGEFEQTVKGLAADALRDNNESFLRLAGQSFTAHRQAAETLLGTKEKAIEDLLAPINTSLEQYRKGLSDIEKAREAAYGGLTTQLAAIDRETRQLTMALRSAPQTRGRWGELQFKNLIELAGMAAHVDYVEQQSFDGKDGKIRPDAVIRVPGDRRIIVDIKTPLIAYLDAVATSDETAREEHLRRHAQHVRTHMRQLSDKEYWDALLPLTPDYVVMFIPGENFYSAAVEHDRDLYENALERKVLIVTPTTMMALAKTIANGWDQHSLATEANRVADLGRELYKRLATMGSHIVQLGTSLRRSVEHYNAFVGSVEGSVMPSARRFNELPIARTREALPALPPIEADTRQIRADRDLIVGPREAEIIPLVSGNPAE